MAVKIINGRQIITGQALQVFGNGALQSSEGAGDIEVLWDEAFYQLTTDAGVFGNSSAMFIDADIVFFQAPDTQGGVNEFLIDSDISFVLGDGIVNRFFVKAGATTPILEAYRDTVNSINVFKSNMPIFADQAAAVTGGLVQNGFYRTLAGAVMLVTP